MKRRAWRAGLLGRILRLHSPGGHVTGRCWCVTKEERLALLNIWSRITVSTPADWPQPTTKDAP